MSAFENEASVVWRAAHAYRTAPSAQSAKHLAELMLHGSGERSVEIVPGSAVRTADEGVYKVGFRMTEGFRKRFALAAKELTSLVH